MNWIGIGLIAWAIACAIVVAWNHAAHRLTYVVDHDAVLAEHFPESEAP